MSKQWKSGNTPENIPKDSRKGIYEIWEYVGCSVVLGSDHINLEKNTKVRYWKVVKHVKKEVGNRFVPCSSSVPCYPHPSIPPLHSASLPSLFYPLLFLSLPQIQNMSSLLPFPSVTPPPCRHTHTHTHTNTPTQFLFDHIAHVPVWRIGISDVNIDSSSVGSQRLFHNEVHSLVSSVSLRKKKNGKKL